MAKCKKCGRHIFWPKKRPASGKWIPFDDAACHRSHFETCKGSSDGGPHVAAASVPDTTPDKPPLTWVPNVTGMVPRLTMAQLTLGIIQTELKLMRKAA